MEETCPECKAKKEKFVYDSNANEVICSVCGFVLDSYEIVDSSDFEENCALINEIYGLGNPMDDERFLKFMRKRVMMNAE
jgi:rubredoxin